MVIGASVSEPQLVYVHDCLAPSSPGDREGVESTKSRYISKAAINICDDELDSLF